MKNHYFFEKNQMCAIEAREGEIGAKRIWFDKPSTQSGISLATWKQYSKETEITSVFRITRKQVRQFKKTGVAPTPKPPKYNHMFDVAFSLNTDLTVEALFKPENSHLLVTALQERVNTLGANPQDRAEAFGHCDTYEN